jgi:hypothetical protein
MPSPRTRPGRPLPQADPARGRGEGIAHGGSQPSWRCLQPAPIPLRREGDHLVTTEFLIDLQHHRPILAPGGAGPVGQAQKSSTEDPAEMPVAELCRGTENSHQHWSRAASSHEHAGGPHLQERRQRHSAGCGRSRSRPGVDGSAARVVRVGERVREPSLVRPGAIERPGGQLGSRGPASPRPRRCPSASRCRRHADIELANLGGFVARGPRSRGAACWACGSPRLDPRPRTRRPPRRR